MAGLTFADAYSLRKKMEENERGFTKGQARGHFPQVTNIADMDAVMHKIIKDLQDDTKTVSKNMKATLKSLPPHFVKHVTSWHDDDGLDLLHHFIINNKADMIAFILGETHYFPLGYVPPCNPYAHLAAILGYVESLKVILQYRPGTFFRTDKPSHAIKLPDFVMRKTRLNRVSKSAPKGAGKFLEKVKHSTLHAEKMMQIFQSAEAQDADVTAVLNTELGAIEKTFVKSKKRLPKLISSTDKIKQTRRKSLPFDRRHADEANRQLAHLKSATRIALQKSPWYRLRKVEAEDNFSDHFRRRLDPECEDHCITVFWDVFSKADARLGVLNRAGEPVKLKYAPNAQAFRPSLSLYNDDMREILEFEDTFTLRESSSTHRPRMASHHSSSIRMSKISKRALKTLEPGVRGNKKYKEFHLKANIHVSEKDDTEKYMHKTPLTYAAERGHTECVQYLLETVVNKRHPSLANKEPLTLATKARSPETILLLLEKKVARSDYQSAVVLSIREMYPDCLTALLTNKGKDRSTMFDGTNLYHILYSQSVISSRRYELMPEMTRALISAKEDVNSHNTPRTYPMYTLINCAFNITVGKQIFFFIDCLHILLECKANPHFDETKSLKSINKTDNLMFSRQAYSSAIGCVFESAKNSVNFFESSYWSNLFMKKFITTIEMFDLTPRRMLNNILFDYMEAVCVLGLDRTIVRCLLRYGGNPDFMKNGKYVVNVYFDQILPYLTKFEIFDTSGHYHQELTTLMIISKSMSINCLSEALHIFLSEHLLSAPIQALSISREFASLMDQMLRTPRPLMELVAQAIWVITKRNKKKVKALPISESFKSLIIP
ncbi:hypothetical protein ElyMa_004038700 [Elysia marginata]|uniref:SOCS box domain-containing protein n=1 Tax=Elysia marginata TaxID=1093978 RepID=A0AAV4G3L5_9GAST|nr:hypothetical protein ElyMa_004038700 [Elysia marginata]